MTLISYPPNITETKIPDASIVFTGGGWSNNSGGGAFGGTNASSGSMQVTSTAGNTVTITTQPCTDVFLNTVKGGDCGPYTVTYSNAQTGGVATAYPEYFTCQGALTGGYIYRTGRALRNLSSSAMVQTIVITCTAGDFTKIQFDSVITVDATNKIKGASSNYTAYGDSTMNNFAVATDFTVPNQLSRMLAGRGVAVNVTNRASTGQAIAGTFIHPIGGFQALYQNIGADAAGLITTQWALNDLRAQAIGQYYGGADYLGHYMEVMHLLDAACDKATVTVCICNGPYAHPSNFATHQNIPLIAAQKVSTGSFEEYEVTMQAFRSIANAFPWFKFADTFEAMDYNDQLIYPNAAGSQPDFLHPNQAGAGVEAARMFAAIMGLY